MASAIFAVPVASNSPALTVGPDAEAQCLGFSCIGQVPVAATCLVRVYGTKSQLDALANDAKLMAVEAVEGTLSKTSTAVVKTLRESLGVTEAQYAAGKRIATTTKPDDVVEPKAK